MKIFQVHNYYQQPGGEDEVFEAEVNLILKMKHESHALRFENHDLKAMSVWKQSTLTLWNQTAYWRMRKAIQQKRPNILHVHNTFPLASPALIHAAKTEGVPLVMSLHNYRLLCPGALLMRQGQICEECLRKLFPWPGVLHGCWRSSKSKTAVVTIMLGLHRLLKTWTKHVDLYIALTEFSRMKFIAGGLPAEKIVVKPNFATMDTSFKTSVTTNDKPYALFVGRLSSEKGIRTLLNAWLTLQEIPLKIVGDGPLLEEIKMISNLTIQNNVSTLGRQNKVNVFHLMQKARFLVFPSECFETFGMTIVEAFANGLPVIASRLGAMKEIVDDGRTGLLFEHGNAKDLANKLTWAWTHPEEVAEMGKEARCEYETKYTAEKNYKMLIDIYKQAIANHRRG